MSKEGVFGRNGTRAVYIALGMVFVMAAVLIGTDVIAIW